MHFPTAGQPINQEIEMVKTHEIFGNNFHGNYRVKVRGPAEGFDLSPAQLRRIRNELCPFLDCKCGGGYGSGQHKNSASFEWVDQNRTRLVPAI